jgi:predicted Fe-Mo cluster-binding NifX family protein
MKVAICSSDGTKVDLHFGKTNTFHIYNFEGGKKSAIALREIEKYSPIQMEVSEGTNQHPFFDGEV